MTFIWVNDKIQTLFLPFASLSLFLSFFSFFSFILACLLILISHVGLVDFGFATLQENIKISDQVGSFLWVAPEVILKSHRASPKSDIWGLGVLLLELLELEAPLPPTSAYNPSNRNGASEPAMSSREKQGLMCLYIAEYGFDFINFKAYHPTIQDFLSKIFVLDPHSRASVDELLEHPFITEYY